MNKKIIGIYICTLLIATVIYPVSGAINICLNEPDSESYQHIVTFSAFDNYELGTTIFENSEDSTDVILARSLVGNEDIFCEIPPGEWIEFYPDGSYVGSIQFECFQAEAKHSATTITYTVTKVSNMSSGPTNTGPWNPIKVDDKLTTCTWYKRDQMICSSLEVTDGNGNTLSMPHTDIIFIIVPHHVPNDPRFENINQYKNYADFNYASFDSTLDYCIATGNTMVKEAANIGLSTEIAEAIVPQRGEPAICCDPGMMDWTDVDPGATVQGSFFVWNCGDPGSVLTWSVDDWPTWMTGAVFTPSGGTILESDPGTNVDFTFTAPNQQNQNYAGTIKVINVDDPSDFCEMSTTLVTPRVKTIHNNFFYQYLHQLPNMLHILHRLLFRI
jgi:hypothetical protein